MRSKAIEIQMDTELVPQEILEDYDSEYSSSKDAQILWIHDDGYKPFSRDLFPYMNAVTSVFNRNTKTNHLNLYLDVTGKSSPEIVGEVEAYGIDTGDKQYKNITWTELSMGQLDPADLLLKSEITI